MINIRLPGLNSLLNHQRSRLLRCKITTKQRLLAIEILDNLLQRRIFRLNIIKVNHDELNRKPAVIHNVVFPVEFRQCDGVDVRVEEQREIDGQER